MAVIVAALQCVSVVKEPWSEIKNGRICGRFCLFRRLLYPADDLGKICHQGGQLFTGVGCLTDGFAALL